MKSTNIKNISTKTGDKGFASDYSGGRHQKDSALFEALGTIDELSSCLGICFHLTNLREIQIIQGHLQQINSMIATLPNHPNYAKLKLITDNEVAWLESFEEKIMEKVDLEKAFVLPGSDSTYEGSWIDFARAVARRTERRFFAFVYAMKRTDLDQCGSYLNRLSDLLFLLARASK